MDSQFPKVSDTRSWSNGDNDMLDHDRDLMLDKHSFYPMHWPILPRRRYTEDRHLCLFWKFWWQRRGFRSLALNRSNENVASGYVLTTFSKFGHTFEIAIWEPNRAMNTIRMKKPTTTRTRWRRGYGITWKVWNGKEVFEGVYRYS